MTTLEDLERRITRLEAAERMLLDRITDVRLSVERLSVYVKVMTGVAAVVSPALTAGILQLLGG